MGIEALAREALKARGVSGAELELLLEIVLENYHQKGGEQGVAGIMPSNTLT